MADYRLWWCIQEASWVILWVLRALRGHQPENGLVDHLPENPKGTNFLTETDEKITEEDIRKKGKKAGKDPELS